MAVGLRRSTGFSLWGLRLHELQMIDQGRSWIAGLLDFDSAQTHRLKPVLRSPIQRNGARCQKCDKLLVGLEEIVFLQRGGLGPLETFKYQVLQ
jgi:hypothetical protein